MTTSSSQQQADHNLVLHRPAHQKQDDDDADEKQHHRHSKKHHHHVYDGTIPYMPFFSMIYQRQRWGETQSHGSGNYSDTFFDLFYVAMAYNLGSLMKDDLTPTGILYLLGSFLPLQSFWNFNLYLKARFDYLTHDIYHSYIIDNIQLIALATAVVHIRSVVILSNSKLYIDMFLFCISLSIAYSVSIYKMIEIMICTKLCTKKSNNSNNNGTETNDNVNNNKNDGNTTNEGSNIASNHNNNRDNNNVALYPEAYGAARRDLILLLIPSVFFVVATIYSGLQYFHHQGDDQDSSASSSSANKYEVEDDNNNNNNDNHIRFLGSTVTGTDSMYDNEDDKSSKEQDNIPIWLLLGGILANHVWGWFIYLYKIPRTPEPSRRLISVPLNMKYIIHRYQEWILLMMGESVLSLLIVELVETWDYFITFFFGILSIILLQYLHFRSQPHDPDEHAMRRNVRHANIFVLLMEVYSASLIVLGVSYKMFLYEFVMEQKNEKDDYNNGNDESHRSLFHHHLDMSSVHKQSDSHPNRWLAGGSGISGAASGFDTYERQQRIAYLFSGSLALVFFCMDGMTLTHQGFQHNREKCTNSTTLKSIGILLIFVRIGIIFFVGTLPLYVTDPKTLSGIGLVCIFVQLIVRAIGSFLFFPMDSKEFAHVS